MELTPAGRALLGPAHDLLDAEVAATAAVQRITDTINGVLDIAVMPALARAPVPDWVARFRALYPDVLVRLHPYVGQESVDTYLRRGPCELVITHSETMKGSSINQIELETERFVVAFPPESRVPSGSEISLKDMRNTAVVISPAQTSMRILVEQAYARADVDLQIAVETEFMDSFAPLVLAGAGCAFMPSRVAPALVALGIVVRRLQDPIERPINLVHANRGLTRAAQQFIAMALEVEWDIAADEHRRGIS